MQHQIIGNQSIKNQTEHKAIYFRTVLKDTNYVLCKASAAEYLGLCNANFSANIYVITTDYCKENNIEYFERNGIYCTTLNQTVNDLLADEDMDEQVILETLADLYFDRSRTAIIKPENMAAFNHFEPMAEEYYDTGG